MVITEGTADWPLASEITMATDTQIDGVKNAHTPGPWSIITDDHDISVSGEGWFEDQNVNGWMIVGNIDNPNMAIAVLDTGFQNQWNDAENDANARLIAAAPDLLDAILAAEKLWSTREAELGMLSGELTAVRNIARAAITKATAA